MPRIGGGLARAQGFGRRAAKEQSGSGSSFMRILISNPDTIGDVVLRQPMFSALAGAGHELMLVVRPMLAPIMGMIAPGARVEVCDLPLYDARLGADDAGFAPLVGAAAAFDPDVLIVAAYQWTSLEERLAFELRRARCFAMSGYRFGDPNHGEARPSRIEPAVVVEVARDLPELKKNERMASAVLGRAVSLPEPELKAGEGSAQAAGAALGRMGLSPGGYWVACVGHSAPTAVRNWGIADWASVLSACVQNGERVLFVGLRAEAEMVASVRSAMGPDGAGTAEWIGDEGGDLETLVGLVAASRGYIGRDTGPMHLAAALGRPVVAVFGGGTWPRFVPAGERSIAITVGVPCTGCEWRCHLPESYCIKRVPVDEVNGAFEEVRSGPARGPRARVLPADTELLGRIGREGAETARRRLVQVSVARRELAEERKSMNQNGAAVESGVETLYGSESRPRREESVAQIAQLQAKITDQARLRGEQAAAIESLREQLGEAKARIRDLETRLERRVAEVMTATAEAATARERQAQAAARQAESDRALATARREADQAMQQADGQAEALKRVQAEAAQLRAELQQVRQQAQQSAKAAAAAEGLRAQLQEVKQGAAALATERAQLVEELKGARADREKAARRLEGGEGQAARLAAAQKALGKAQADLHDLQAKAQRYETERVALAKLSKQQEERIAVLRERLANLLDSRWRKYGQRLGLAMTLPWEEEARNGRA
jgi:ADP-heptose:LPS heptosyltransferase/predicted  nucleic acid-binding Zn-ribbon protein